HVSWRPIRCVAEATKSPAVAAPVRSAAIRSLREWIRTKLELYDFGLRPFATFHMEWRAGAGGRPEPFALPAGLGIVDAAVHPLSVEPQRIGHTESNKLPVH